MRRALVSVLCWWFVVTYSGQVMGPFSSYSECNAWARILSELYWNVRPYCELR